jgi:hypothetical protein
VDAHQDLFMKRQLTKSERLEISLRSRTLQHKTHKQSIVVIR